MKIKIRKILNKDLDACARIPQSIEFLQRYDISYERSLQLFKERIGNPNRTTMVLEVDGEVEGFVDIVLKGSFGLSHYVEQLMVSNEFAGQGLGHRLMDFAEEELKGNRFGVSLLVNEENDPAIRFYKKRGYAQVGRLEGYIKPELNELIFLKRFQ